MLANKRILFLVEDGFEDLEFWAVLMHLQAMGAAVTVAAPKVGVKYVSKSGGLTASADIALDAAHADNFDALVIPGGWAPDKLRRYAAVKAIAQAMHAQGKIIGMICHAGWVGASAGIIRGRRATGSLGIKDDLENAGAIWVDTPALQDGNLVWGRVVPDIPAFCAALTRALGAA